MTSCALTLLGSQLRAQAKPATAATPISISGRWVQASQATIERTVGKTAKALRNAHRCRSPHVDMTYLAGRVRDCPERDPIAQARLFTLRAEAARSAFLETLGLDAGAIAQPPVVTTGSAKAQPPALRAPSGRLHLYVLKNAALHRMICPHVTGIRHQGVGVRGLGDPEHGPRLVYAVHQTARTLGRDADLHRNLVHNLIHLLIDGLQPLGTIDNRGLGWLDAGLAHYFEAELVDGSCRNFCFHERAQAPLRFHDGAWLDTARKLHRHGAIPSWRSIFGKDRNELLPEEHVFSFAFVHLLIAQGGGGPHLGQLLLRLKRGEDLDRAAQDAFGTPLADLMGRFDSWLVPNRSEANELNNAQTAHRRAALYIYTRPLVRPRHRAVVAKALRRRAEAHESGWKIVDREPLHALGPVKRAAHWKGTRQVKPIWAAWPFAAVLEYSGDEVPAAFIDWTRRRRHSGDDGGWFLDPAGTYVEHINAEMVFDQDNDLHYMAVVDTPTGDVMQSNEFAVRGRVRWADGVDKQVGWWVRFDTPRARRPEHWVETLHPLVPWRLHRRLSASNWSSSDATQPTDQLAPFASPSIFELPRIPRGMRAGR